MSSLWRNGRKYDVATRHIPSRLTTVRSPLRYYTRTGVAEEEVQVAKLAEEQGKRRRKTRRSPQHYPANPRHRSRTNSTLVEYINNSITSHRQRDSYALNSTDSMMGY